MAVEPTLSTACETLLCCSALRRELGSLLFYGTSSDGFDAIVDRYASILRLLGEQVEIVRLTSNVSEDELWGSGFGLEPPWFSRGLLVTDAASSALHLVVIPDLAALSLPAARAAVQLMGAPRGYLERSGQQLSFEPRLRWLAACSHADIGRVSPHLLERFALRSTAASLRPLAAADALRQLKRTLTQESDDSRASSSLNASAALSDAVLKRAQAANARLTSQAVDAVVARCAGLERPGMRTEISLAYTALALTQLAGRAIVSEAEVAHAARLHELPEGAKTPPPVTEEQPEPTEPPSSTKAKPAQRKPMQSEGGLEVARANDAAAGQVEGAAEGTARDATALAPLASNETQTLSQVQVLVSAVALEREAPVNREATPLRLAFTHGRAKRKGTGDIVGVEPSSTFDDLAICATILASAPYQTLRRTRSGKTGPALLLAVDDLRTYRRAPAVESMFVLLLDYTSLPTENWGPHIVPFLRSAYTERARVAVVQVGGSESQSELRAELVLARNILAPAVAAAFDRKPGRSTPLAHGLATALDVIQRATNHGRSAVKRVTFVAVTDGRGNIPLLASRTGNLAGRVTSEGIDDAMQQAQLLGREERVRSVVLDPGPTTLGHLPRTLAARLRAEVVELAPQLGEA